MAVRTDGSPEGQAQPSGDLTFDDLAKEIVDTYLLSNRLGTAKTAKHWLSCLLKYFSNREIKTISSDSFYKEYVAFARRIRPGGNLNEERKFFVMVLNLAWRKGLTPRPPGRIPRPDPEKDVGRELTDAEISKLLLACRKPEIRFQILFAIKTGMRKRELLKLQYEFIDWELSVIRLPPWFTKTRKGRTLAIDAETVIILFQRMKLGNSKFVFPTPKDPLVPINDNKKAWETVKRRSGIRCRWHDLRHTCVTRMVRAKVPLATISRFLGMSQKVLLRVYHHTSVDDLHDAARSVRLPGFG